MTPNLARHSRGFTLVEMLIVVALIGVVAGMSLPSFIKAQRYSKVTNNSNALYTGLSRARAIAMRKQRPVLITVATASTPYPTLTLTAILDADFSAAPGPGTPGDINLVGNESPFPSGQLALVARDFSFGHPALSGSIYTSRTSNLGAATWFGFDAAGKLIPNGRAPFGAALDVTSLMQYPDTAKLGGPEFYFAEAGAATTTNAVSHTYRKIEINSFGAIRTLAWNVQSNQWKGVQ